MTFEDLRIRYPVFRYDAYHIERTADEIVLTFDFTVPGLCAFHPQTRIPTARLQLVNAWDSETARTIVFSLGLTEAVSYWKAVCSPVIEVCCGQLTPAQQTWWKTLWYNGLGEFFFRNGIETDADSFVQIRCGGSPCVPSDTFRNAGLCLVPVGGGKDSAVTLSLLHDRKEKIRAFTVNDQQARPDTVTAAGLSADCMVRTCRTIDSELLRLNREGFLNGHTPFSAIVAFLSLYCAYLIGAEYIVLSNESSANESNIAGTEVNHQYSKSYAFERDFTDYVRDVIGLPVRYFSLLRPFNEMQIARQFAALPQYHAVFKSCNAGSKKNIWCCNCAKCLFVYCILSPFLPEEKLTAIFGENLLEKESLKADFDGLCGLSDIKPFECIGTVREVCAALRKTIAQDKAQGKSLPALLRYADGKLPDTADDPLLDFNAEHHVPPAFQSCVKEMLRFVRAD